MKTEQKFSGYTGELIDDGFGAIPIEAVDGKIIPERDFISGIEEAKKIRVQTSTNTDLILRDRIFLDQFIKTTNQVTLDFFHFVNNLKGVENYTVHSSRLQHNFSYYGAPIQIQFLSPFTILYNGNKIAFNKLITQFKMVEYDNSPVLNMVIGEVIKFYASKGLNYRDDKSIIKIFFQGNLILSQDVLSYFNATYIMSTLYQAFKQLETLDN